MGGFFSVLCHLFHQLPLHVSFCHQRVIGAEFLTQILVLTPFAVLLLPRLSLIIFSNSSIADLCSLLLQACEVTDFQHCCLEVGSTLRPESHILAILICSICSFSRINFPMASVCFPWTLNSYCCVSFNAYLAFLLSVGGVAWPFSSDASTRSS